MEGGVNVVVTSGNNIFQDLAQWIMAA